MPARCRCCWLTWSPRPVPPPNADPVRCRAGCAQARTADGRRPSRRPRRRSCDRTAARPRWRGVGRLPAAKPQSAVTAEGAVARAEAAERRRGDTEQRREGRAHPAARGGHPCSGDPRAPHHGLSSRGTKAAPAGGELKDTATVASAVHLSPRRITTLLAPGLTHSDELRRAWRHGAVADGRAAPSRPSSPRRSKTTADTSNSACCCPRWPQ